MIARHNSVDVGFSLQNIRPSRPAVIRVSPTTQSVERCAGPILQVMFRPERADQCALARPRASEIRDLIVFIAGLLGSAAGHSIHFGSQIVVGPRPQPAVYLSVELSAFL